MAWVGAACQQVRRRVPRIWQELGIRLSVSTLRRALRQAGCGWKRMRRSLKARRDPGAFAAAQQQLAALHRAEQRGELAVCYADEVRFSRRAPVPYAWQLRGQPPVGLTAERGAGAAIRCWDSGAQRARKPPDVSTLRALSPLPPLPPTSSGWP